MRPSQCALARVTDGAPPKSLRGEQLAPAALPASSARGPLRVHCQGGYRASIAASLLHAAGRAVTAADDDFSCAAAAGWPLPGEPGYSPAGALAVSAGRTGRAS